jgi:hypothetical protein
MEILTGSGRDGADWAPEYAPVIAIARKEIATQIIFERKMALRDAN